MSFCCFTFIGSVSAYFIISFQMIAISNKNKLNLPLIYVFFYSFISMKHYNAWVAYIKGDKCNS